MANDLNLKVTLTGDGKRLSGTLDNAQSEVRQFGDMSDRQGQRASAAMDRTGQSVETVSGHLREMNGVGQTVRSTLLGVGTALAGAFAAGSIRNQARVISDTNALAQSLEVSTGKMQAWQYAGEQVGLQGDKMGDIFKDTSDKLGDFARTGGGEAVDLIEQMGLNINKLVQLSPDQQLLKIGEALDGLTASERTFFLESLADEAVRLQPLLEDNAAGLREYTAEAYALGVAMDDGAIASAVQANRAMLQLEGAINGLVNQLTAELGPGLASTVGDFTDWIERAGGAEAVLEDITTVATTLAVLLAGRYAGALATATQGLVTKTAASLADARAEASAAQQVTRRTAAERTAAMALLASARTEERATRGTSAHAFALQQLSVARVRATEAAGAHTAATNASAAAMGRASVAARGMTAAGRAGAGALALIGGPAGAAIVAAGALYTFREELGLSETQAQRTASRVDDLTNAINLNSEAAVKSQLATLAGEMYELEQRSASVKGKLDELSQNPGTSSGVLGMAPGETGEQARLIQELGQIADEQFALSEAADRLSKVQQKLREQGTAPLADSTRDLTSATGQATKATSSASEATDTFQSDLESLRQQLDPAYAASQRLAESTALLDRGLASGALSLDEYLALWDKAAERFSSAGDGAKEAAKTVDDESDAMATTWERRIERMDDAAVDMWRSFLDGSEDAFSSFKRLAINTLAEVIHQYTTRQITASIGANIGGGQGGGGIGGIPGLGSVVDSASGWLGFGGSSLGAAGTAAIGYGSGFGAAASTGAYTGWAGSAAAGAASSGGFMGAVGSAMPWVGGAMLVDNVLGLGIVDGIVEGISGLFGGSPTPFSGRFGTTGSLDRSEGAGKDGVFEHQGGERFWNKSALGYTGFRDVGTERLQRAGIGEDKQWAEDLATTTAQIDNLVASLADGQGELQGMRDAVQSMEISSSNAGEIVEFAVKDRALAALQTLGYTISSEVANLPADEFAARMENMVGGIRIVEAAADRLNLQFDETASGALSAAGSLAQLAGGTQQLQSLQQNYYQTIYSKEERLNRLRSDVTAQLQSMGYALPRSREGFRDLVEVQNLNTQAGRENYTQLLHLVDSFDQLKSAAASADDGVSELDQRLESLTDKIGGLKDDVKSAYEAFQGQAFDQRLTLLELAGESEQALALEREQQLEGMDPLLQQTQKHIWALQDEKEAQQEAAKAGQEYARALADAQSWLGSTLESIRGWIDSNQSTDAGLGAPADQLAAAGEAYREQLKAARNGDRSALENITQYADRFIDAQKGWSASGGETTALIDRIETQLGNLPDQLTAEEYIADEITGALVEQTDGITSTLTQVLRSDTPSNIAQQLAGSFDDLTRGVGDVLTREQLAIVMDGKATDAQLDAVMRAVDLNGDGVMSGLESVIIKSMPTDATLANALQKQLQTNGNKALTVGQVRQALQPIASDKRINKLIRRVDDNGDGLLSAQEVTSNRLSGLAQSIGGALSPLFDQIDTSLDGLINYDEFGKQFRGMASDKLLRRIFSKLDKNGDGTISELEALKGSTDKVDQNTQSLEERSLDQLSQLNSLVNEMTNTTDQFVQLDSTMVSLRDSINALGVAQKEQARIERRRAARERREQERLEQERREAVRAQRASIKDEIAAIKQERKAANWMVSAHQNQSLDWSIAGFYREHSNVRKGSGHDLDELLSGDYNYTYRPELGTSKKISKKLDKYNAAHDVIDNASRELDALRSQLASLPGFALGGVFNNGIVDRPTRFNIAEMGEAGPEAIMPLQRGPDGALGVRAEIQPVVMPPPSLNHVSSRDDALHRETVALQREMAKLLEELRRYAQSDQAQRGEGFKRLERATERGNKMLARMTSDRRLEEARA